MPRVTQNFITIATESLSAAINPLGAELSILRDGDGRDLLWNGDPAVWKGRAPILFPIIGELAGGEYRLGDKTYRMARHGFARNRVFQVVETNASSVLFRQSWDDETLTVYPFRFQLDLGFALADSALTITATIRNLGEAAMPASFGFHPALRWPLPYAQSRAAHKITFEEPESAPMRQLDAKGLVQPQSLPTPIEDKMLRLRDDLFTHDALIFDALASHRVTYGADEGPQIRIEFPGMPYLGIWTKPGANFICIEPWAGMADPQGYPGDFRDKPGSFAVAPGGTHQCRMIIHRA